MTELETLDLLLWLGLLDSRNGSGSDPVKLKVKASAWHEQLPSDLGVPEAKDICRALMLAGEHPTPVAIYRRFAERRTPKHRQGLDTAPAPAIEAAPAIARPAPPAAITAGAPAPLTGPGTTSTLDTLGIRRSGAHTPELAVACPRCGARPHKPCTIPSGERLSKRPAHPAREEAWRAAQTDPQAPPREGAP